MFDSFPYLDYTDINLDWIIKEMKNALTEWSAVKNEWSNYKEYIDNYFRNLDVTQEIRDKIDDMIADGTFSRLLNDVVGNDATPQFVDAVTEMTDNSKIYVLNTTGEVYYYNGTTWVATGLIYGQGQNCIRPFNHLIAVSTYQDLNITDFNNLEPNHIYAIGGTDGDPYLLNSPPDVKYPGTLLDYVYTISGDTGRTQIFKNPYNTYSRNKWGNDWTPWKTDSFSSLVYITPSNVGNYTNVFNFEPNKTYLFGSGITSDHVANLPKYGTSGILFITDYNNTPASGNGRIFIFTTNSKMFYNMRVGNNYAGWREVFTDFPYAITNANKRGYVGFNDIDNGLYTVGVTADQFANCPAGNRNYGYLISIADSNGIQLFIDRETGVIWQRQKWNSNYGSWFKLNNIGYNINSVNAIAAYALSNDLNDWTESGLYAVGASLTQADLLNLPIGSTAGVLEVQNMDTPIHSGENAICVKQIFIDNSNAIYIREKYSNIWHDWIAITEMGDAYFINTTVNKPFDFTNKKLAGFGDSIMAARGINTPWLSQFCAKAGIINFTNNAVPNARFDTTDPDENYIIRQLENYTEWTTTDIVIIAAGINDATRDIDYSVFRSAVQGVIDYAKQQKPDIEIIFITPIERSNTTHMTVRYCSIISSVALINDCSIINGYDIPIPFRDSAYYTNLTSDGLHPNQTGHNVYARHICGVLL